MFIHPNGTLLVLIYNGEDDSSEVICEGRKFL